MDRRRRLSKSELALWHHAMRDAVPLPGRAPLPAPPPVIPDEPAPAQARPVTPLAGKIEPAISPQPLPLVLKPGQAAPGLDRRSRERLSAGDMPIDARLDLHGLTQDQARAALDAFIARAWDGGLRALLVITGKGASLSARDEGDWNLWSQRGVLRANVPRWLAEAPNRARILAVTPAQLRHGGDGALYVLIRRRRT